MLNKLDVEERNKKQDQAQLLHLLNVKGDHFLHIGHRCNEKCISLLTLGITEIYQLSHEMFYYTFT